MSDFPDESTLMDHLINHIKDNIYFKDREGHFVLINKEGTKRAGLEDPEELIGKTDLDLFTEEHAREALEDEQRIIQTGQPLYGKEEKETWGDGHETWVSTTKMPLRDESGEIIGTFGISRDITQHKKAELLATHYAKENRRLYDEMQSELQMAAELQKTFMPSSYPAFPSGASPSESAARFCHYHDFSGSIGGDFCSVRKISDTEAGILLCDVMGHGVRAALITALIRAIVEEISYREKDPGQFLNHMNKKLKPIIQSDDLFLFSTACYMVLDVATGSLRFALAGHPVPFLLNASTGAAEWLTTQKEDSGPALAIDELADYRTIERPLHPNDAIVMYTDGLYETMDGNGVSFGRPQLLELANQHGSRPLLEMFPLIADQVRAFSANGKFEGDVSLVGCRFAHPFQK